MRLRQDRVNDPRDMRRHSRYFGVGHGEYAFPAAPRRRLHRVDACRRHGNPAAGTFEAHPVTRWAKLLVVTMLVAASAAVAGVGYGLKPGPAFGVYASPGGRYRVVAEEPGELERLWAPHGLPGHVSLYDAQSGQRLGRSGLVAFEGTGSFAGTSSARAC